MQDSTPPLVVLSKKAWQRYVRLLSWAVQSVRFQRAYAIATIVVLFTTTIFWAILGARLQSHNADQLSDPYLFSNWATFHGATFPGAHTFLLKWPIFWLVNLFGASSLSLLIATVGVVVATVATLVVILYKIDRRPLVFGTVCLGLSLALLLIPAQPYAGGILPVNMAMLTTRNLEYAVYLVVLVLFARAHRLRSRSFALGIPLLALLIASDKLFLSLSAGGALLALLIYTLVSNWGLAAAAARWLVGSIVAAIGAVTVLAVITALHLTHLADSVAATPYGVVHSAKTLVLGTVYAVLSLFTNGGANPAFDNKTPRSLPGELVHRLWSFGGLAYLMAAIILICAVVAMWHLIRLTLKSAPARVKPPTANLLALSLIWSTVAAFGVFVFTDHYYAVDARYLSIGLFAAVVSVSVWLRRLSSEYAQDLLLTACVLLVAIGLAATTAFHISTQQTAALSTITQRNVLVADALKQHKVSVLVGDYWRVLPIKLATHGQQNVLPLAGCTQPAGLLTSSTWQPDLHTHSFAYLVTLDGSLTNFPACSLAQITAKYGRPNATQVIAGTLAKPTEALLFYDRGSHLPARSKHVATPAPILPVGLGEVANTGCDQPTVMNVVAHEDDDLLFLSPDLQHDIASGRCVRTVFLTAGDDGQSKFYWITRQLGAEAAYSSMLNSKAVWDQQTVALAPGEYITIATLHGNNKVSLIFFNLPDGNMQGQGFPATHQQSLVKLYNGSISSMQSVDGQSSYTSSQLVNALSVLMNGYQPAAIHTQADVPSSIYPDHSDHITTSKFTELAARQYDQQHFGDSLSIPVSRYIGYPIHDYPTNLSDDDIAKKEAAFFAYGQYDNGTCRTLAACTKATTYIFYLTRQYQE